MRLTRQVSRDSERGMRPTRGRRTGNLAVGKDGRQALNWRITPCRLLRWELPMEPGTRIESSYKAQMKLHQNGVCGLSYLFQLENLNVRRRWYGQYFRCVSLLCKSECHQDSFLRIVLLCYLKMGPVGCAKTSVRNCNYSVGNRPEERSSRLILGRRLKSSKRAFCLWLRPWNLVALFMSFYCFKRIWILGVYICFVKIFNLCLLNRCILFSVLMDYGIVFPEMEQE